MELTQQSELKLYIFAGCPGVPPNVQALHANMDFNLEGAQKKLLESRKDKPFMGFTYCGALPIKDILDKMDTNPVEIKTKKQFINSLKLVADDFIKDPKEANKLKKLLNKI